MADTAIRIPRRKKGVKFLPKEAPFPVPIQSITRKEPCSDRWYYYTGYFRDNCVVIEDLGDLTFLYKMVSLISFPVFYEFSQPSPTQPRSQGPLPPRSLLTIAYSLILQGFFGKGILSRSKPEYEVISNISQKAFSKSEKLRRCKFTDFCNMKVK